jgi:hypothetical protein
MLVIPKLIGIYRRYPRSARTSGSEPGSQGRQRHRPNLVHHGEDKVVLSNECLDGVDPTMRGC